MNIMFAQADATKLPLADKSVDLILGSPPYLDARTYGIDAQRDLGEWVAWMLEVTTEAVRVCRGLVLWVVAGVTRDWCYQPGPEALLADWVRMGGIAWRPAYWRRVGIPGSGGTQWLRADIEYVLAFVGDRGEIPWAENTANGHQPKYAPGGEMSYRLANGERRNQWGGTPTKSNMAGRKSDGEFKESNRPGHRTTTITRRKSSGLRGDRKSISRERDGMHSQESTIYTEPAIANPGNLVTTKVGGGAMGHPLAHENEAPFPQRLAEWFIRSHCRPGGITLDPFSGSGTTVAAAQALGRVGIGFDLRLSQCLLGRRRMECGVQKSLLG